MKFNPIYLSLAALLALEGCKDDGQVGSVIQPEEDLLHAYSAMTNLTSSSFMVDSTLSKADGFYLGEYTDPVFGTTKVEFLSQIDSRVDGLVFPNTSVVTAKSTTAGILDSLLQSVDSKYGKILSIESPTNVVIDSAFFEMNYGDTFFGDSTTLQAVKVYALSSDLNKSKLYYTDTKVSDYCDKDTLLGEISYQIQKSRRIRVPLSEAYVKRLVGVYGSNSKIKTQAQFDKLFKGVYVSHSFNGGGIIGITSAGFHLFYTYDAMVKTTYDGRDTIVNTAKIKNSKGEKMSVLATDLFLSANKSVARINIVEHNDLEEHFSALDEDFSYIFAPAGIYTTVNVSLKDVKDSIKKNAADLDKIMFNSARLKVWAKDLDWKTDLSKRPYNFLLLMKRDSVVSFFAKNKTPDGETAFIAAYDTASCAYSFDVTKAMQKEIRGFSSIDGELVIVPVNRAVGDMTYNSYVYTYSQVFSTSAARFHNAKSEEKEKRPRIDFVYTRRE